MGRIAGLWLLVSLFCLPGCGPKYSYPAKEVPKSVEEITVKEYQTAVQARVVGNTLGAVTYVQSILSDKGQIPREIHEKIGQVMQVVTRVALSTDLPIEFTTVIMRDRTHGDELTITRYLDDVKRANAEAIGIEESIARTIFSHNRVAKGALPGAFVLKEIKLEDFLAEQMVQRIRMSFTDPQMEEGSPEEMAQRQPFVLVDGSFEKTPRRAFHFSVIALKSEDPRMTVLNIFKTMSAVIRGYRFDAFDVIEVQDYLNRQKLVVDREAYKDYEAKKITDDQLLSRFLIQSQSIQEAFKLFGFNMPQEAAKAVDPLPQ